MTTPAPVPEFVYKVATAALVAQSQASGHFLGAPIDLADGYIHLSTGEQLRETLRLRFPGQSDLVVFAVRTADLGAALRWEPSRGGALFPHLYGPLAMSQVTDSAPISVGMDGAVDLPGWVR